MEIQNYLTNKYRDTIKSIIKNHTQIDEDYSIFEGKNINSLQKELFKDEYIKNILFDDSIHYLQRIHVLLQATNSKKNEVSLTKECDGDVIITLLDRVFEEFVKKLNIRINSLKFFKHLGYFFQGKDIIGSFYKNENRSLSFTDLLDDELEHFSDVIYYIPKEYIQDAINFNTSLEKLYFGRISDETIVGMCKAMETNTTIKHIRLEIYGEDEYFNVTKVIDSLIDMFRKNKTLRRVDLIGEYGDFFIKNHKLTELFKTMNNGVLEHIQLNCFNHMRNLKTQMNFSNALEKLLENNSSLGVLNLCHCEMNGIMCGIFSRVLPNNTQLETLMLPINNIGDNGLACIMHGLEKNTTLRTLDVSYNQFITPDFIQKFQETFKKKIHENELQFRI